MADSAELTDEQLDWCKWHPESGWPNEPVWTTDTLQRDFTVEGFQAPYVMVTRKSDGKRGSLAFNHRPRVYHSWKEDTP